MTGSNHTPRADERLTSEAYWTSTWARRSLLAPARWERHPAVRAMARVIEAQLALLPDARREKPRVLEVGCADSYWLPYAARKWGADVTGVDFSATGCQQAEEQLERQGQTGTVICADFFAPNDFAHRFDLILSFGFVEHFDPPRMALRQMVGHLAEGGRLFAAVPNLAGAYGPMQWLINPAVYRAHVRLTAADLTMEAESAGVADPRAGYCGGPLHFGVLNFAKGRTAFMSRGLRQVGRALSVLDRNVARVSDLLGSRFDSGWFSPHAYVVGGVHRGSERPEQ